MSSCAVNASTPMSRSARLTRTGSVTPANTAALPRRQFRRRISHLEPRGGLPLGGEREQPFLAQRMPDKRRRTPPAAPNL